MIPGEDQPGVVHALAHAINEAIGAVGSTVVYTDPIAGNWVNENASLKELVNDINAGTVEFLVILGGNPVYNVPVDTDFASNSFSRTAEGLPGDVLQRDRSRLRLGDCRNAFPGRVERCSRGEWRSQHRSAADFAAVWWAQRARNTHRAQWSAGCLQLRPGSRLLANAVSWSGFRSVLAARGA